MTKANKPTENVPLFVAIGIGLMSLSALQPAFYYLAIEAWHYYLMMYVAEMLITGAIIKCCKGEQYYAHAICVYSLSMLSYFIGLVITLLYAKGYVDRNSAGLAIDSISSASELLFIASITIACFNIKGKFTFIK